MWKKISLESDKYFSTISVQTTVDYQFKYMKKKLNSKSLLLPTKMCLMDLQRIIVLCLPSLLFAATTEPGKYENFYNSHIFGKLSFLKMFSIEIFI